MIALVIGCAACVHDDLRAAPAHDIVVAVNHIGLELPHVDHWASLHADLFPEWLAMRQAAGHPPAGRLWTSDVMMRNRPDLCGGLSAAHYPFDGTSGALGVFVAQAVGADKIILAGVPLKNGPHFYRGPSFVVHDQVRAEWKANRHLLRNVKSMSGWTRGLLGAPCQVPANHALAGRNSSPAYPKA